MNRVEQMKLIQDKALAIFEKKNADYGDSFAKHGLIGVLVRLNDKINRSLNISKTGITLVESESLNDTLLDLHNYSAMALMLLNEDKLNMTSEQTSVVEKETEEPLTVTPAPAPEKSKKTSKGTKTSAKEDIMDADKKEKEKEKPPTAPRKRKNITKETKETIEELKET